jgi:hypothetical protein
VVVDAGAGAADTSPARTVAEVTMDERNRIFERETIEGTVAERSSGGYNDIL